MRPTLTAGLAGALAVLVSALLAPPAQADPEPCFTAGTLDLNGDGHTDAVVGDPYATVSGQPGAGRVVVLYGDADNRVGEGTRTVLTVANLGMTPQPGDHFGWAVGTGNIDMDACADLVVGAPGADLPEVDAGAVHVVYGSTDGINAGTTSEHLTQSDAGGATEDGDRFGESIAVGENLGQDTSVVVAGAPGEDIGAAADAGAVNVVNFSDSIPVQPREVTQNTSGVPDTAEAGDQFGASIALGVDLLRNDHGWELLVGAPGESVGTRGSAGSVTVVSEIQGFPPVGTWEAARYTQNSPGVGDSVEAGDRFGASLAAGTLSITAPSSVRRIAVGVPGEDVGSKNLAGAVNLFTASGSGLAGLKYVTQNTAGVGGASETGDRFGASVAVMPGTTTQRLAVGAPHEDIGSATNAGTVQLFNFHNVASDSSLTQSSPGAAGDVHDQSLYGSLVVALEGDPERAWLVGNPYHATGAVHVVNVTGGFASRAWLPGSGGVPGSATRFGWSAGGHDDLG
jgi:hypothetical protein